MPELRGSAAPRAQHRRARREGGRGRRRLPRPALHAGARLPDPPDQSEADERAGRDARSARSPRSGAASIWSTSSARPQHVPAHVDEILALSPRPLAVWLQLGITHAGGGCAPRGRRHRGGAGPLPDGRAPAPAGQRGVSRERDRLVYATGKGRTCPHCGRPPGGLRLPREPARASRRRHRAPAPRGAGTPRQDGDDDQRRSARRGRAAARSPASSSAAAAPAARPRTA